MHWMVFLLVLAPSFSSWIGSTFRLIFAFSSKHLSRHHKKKKECLFPFNELTSFAANNNHEAFATIIYDTTPTSNNHYFPIAIEQDNRDLGIVVAALKKLAHFHCKMNHFWAFFISPTVWYFRKVLLKKYSYKCT